MRGSYGDGMFGILTVPMSISWLRSCTIILQDVTIRRNCANSTWDLRVVSYTSMCIYNDVKITSLII